MTQIKLFKDQDFRLLEEKHSFKNLFVDPEFPACIQSISHSGKLSITDEDEKSLLNLLEWRRPYELMGKPRFVIDDFQRRDLSQGHVGNCWFIAAAGVLTMNPALLASVIPSNQTFHESEYTGLFHFRFWLFGQWNDVVIDDRLPSYKGKLVFCHNAKEPEELWPALLEKAYAKVCGSYEAMASGRVSDGLMDFTGGIDEIIPLHGPGVPDNMKEMIKRVIAEACNKQSLIGCAIIPQNEEPSEGLLWNGLVTGHAFSITQMKDIKTSNGIVTLVRCLNPWSNAVEWCGDWSDISRLWDEVSPEEKRKFKFSKANDGEFWMSYDDFFANFNLLQICHCRPESMCSWALETSSLDSSSMTLASWHEIVFHGEWKVDESAGGSGQGDQPRDKYWLNPQYLVQLDANNNSNGEEKSYTLIISLMSKQERKLFCNDQSIKLAIGYDIFKVKDGVDVRGHINEGRKMYMIDCEDDEIDSAHIPCRSVSQRFTVPSGTYIIIPSTAKYNDPGQFFLRIFTDQTAAHTVTAELKTNKEKLTEEDIKRPSLDASKEEEAENKNDGNEQETVLNSNVTTSFEKKDVDRKEKLCVLQ